MCCVWPDEGGYLCMHSKLLLLLMKNSGGERMHFSYRECILSPADFDVGSECWDSFCIA